MPPRRKILVVLKGYPRLSETFIAQELLGLEKAGFDLTLISMRRPTDKKRHPVHDEIKARVVYLPEYLHEEPIRVLKGLVAGFSKPGFKALIKRFLADLPRDLSRNRFRRLGQALVLGREWPDGGEWLHAHFIHTPASVAEYASILTGTPWTCSAHAKDIWTSPDWELQEKLGSARWAVTCTRTGYEHMRSLTSRKDAVHLSYHGLDLARFGHFAGERSDRTGSDPDDPAVILSVGRAVEKKGYDVLLRALALLPADLHWRMDHIGGGEALAKLKALAAELGLSNRIAWKGAMAQEDVLDHYRRADLFALACRIAANGDRDGLPNVLVEASSQRLVCVSTTVSGVPELLEDGENGLVVPPEDPALLAKALETAIRDPALRKRLGDAAERRVRADFDYHSSIRQLTGLFEAEWQKAS
ncbi:glycosyltransferase family 4 protein [Rhizobium hidalgonense]|uniref:Colanic acid biosynthesis glycosyltransferase WcaL n=1 Tax=Rhizobium hidalgonense TaxID=1538159 RepID=A0A2A6KEU0_9HYPH|nr:glycosyltransferase family 4 protein [Rhizobium hidalgonense]MDR9772839.1 glycosyltransferase family 4 protein [Rhizobium hidalgonense]MDR9807704.1 glycosyltransferase family 4 protein [Rhizobium hidalgonense]MDR9812961.1 glycosyltransferase family 4 protein [Rhizobium hidalgonense]MDR9820299.1 glycosyltransferase family 4 protein [Rhizobium hidalgonense]PDT23031.1 colanic acid biosynthesis glycosyltransferase WcaL [Rhizobium hidalgonense]